MLVKMPGVNHVAGGCCYWIHSLPLKQFGAEPACLSENCPNIALLSQPGSQAPRRDSRNALEAWLFSLEADFPELVQVLGDTAVQSQAPFPIPLHSFAMSLALFSFLAIGKLLIWEMG